MRIEVMLYVYLFVCVAMIGFNIVTAFCLRAADRKTKHISRHFRARVSMQLEALRRGYRVERSHKQYLSRKLRRIGNMIAFDRMLEEEYIDHPEYIRAYLSELDSVLVSLTADYCRRNRMEAAYFPYIIKKYRLIAYRPFPSIVGTLLSMLNEPSIYCRENAMQALYTTGDADCVVRAIRILDRSPYFFHKKLLCDGMLNFSGSVRELGEKLREAFWDFSVEMRVTVLDYFRLSSDRYGEFALSLLRDEKNDDEIRYACIRILGKYPLNEASDLLRRLAASEAEQKWEYAAIASSALAAYPGPETVEVLKTNLYSPNWYIRLNSAKSLQRLGIPYARLADIIDGKDRYAAEILRYCLLTDREGESSI